MPEMKQDALIKNVIFNILLCISKMFCLLQHVNTMDLLRITLLAKYSLDMQKNLKVFENNSITI